MAGQYVLTPRCEQNQKMFQRLDDAWEPLPGNGHLFVSEISKEDAKSSWMPLATEEATETIVHSLVFEFHACVVLVVWIL